VTDADSSFELLEFEQVQAGSRTVLLRLAARPSETVTIDRLVLIVHADGDPVRLTPLPAPPGPADVFRAAFATAPELLADGTTYTLELADGSLVALPAPRPRSSTRRPLAPPVPERPDAPRLAEAEQRAASRRLAIVELQRRLSAEHSRRSAAEAEARTARAAATAEAARHVELQSRLAEIESDSERLRAALDEANHSAAAEAEAARSELAEREARLQRATGELEARLRSASEELEAVRAGHAQELEGAAASAEELRTRLIELELRLEDEQARLEAAESDVRVGQEQFAGVEAELAGVRAAAAEVAAALADRTTEVELLREAAIARERELEEQLAAQRRAFESADEPVTEPEPGDPPETLASLADALLAGAAEIELLRIASAERPAEVVTTVAEPDHSTELADAERRLGEAQREIADGQRQLADAREQLAAERIEKSDLQERLDQSIAARDLPPAVEASERELIELRGAVERAQNRARLHRQHSSSLEVELTEAKQELTELRRQVAAVTSTGEVAPVEEVEALREQVAYGEAVAADLEWQLDEARVTEEAAEAALELRAAEIELLAFALRELSTPTAGDQA
jgi:chromosome segregation ATPase